MAGICGWLDNTNNSNDPHRALDTMAAGLARLSNEEQYSVQHTSVGLYISSRKGSLHFYQDDRFTIALEGNPRWSVGSLDNLAREKGHGEALLRAYQGHGPLFLEKLHGPFSLALIDRHADDTLIAIDRMGIHRVCYAYASNHGLVFGSTADAVRAHPSVGATLDHQQIFSYLFFHAVPSPGTIYREQDKLLPGQYLRYHQGKLEKHLYWEPEFTEDRRIPFVKLRAELRDQLASAIGVCAGDSQECGAFLSGGVDSSAVTGVLSSLRQQPVKTYSIGFSAKDYDEMEYARIASKHFKTLPHEYYVTPNDVASAVPKIAQAYDEPFGNASAIPTYYCALLAKEHGTEVMLAGDGGDELFGGNARYAQQKIFQFYHRLPRGIRSGMVEPAAFGFPLGDKIWPIRKARSYIQQAKIPMPARLESYNFLNRIERTTMFQPDFLAAVDPEYPENLLRDEYLRSEGKSLINRMMHLEWKQVLADNDLRKVSHMCSLADMQVRFPLLEDELVGFSTRIPPELKVKGLKLRYFFKESMRDFLPPQVLSKSKHGFGLPFGIWLRSEPLLQQLAGDSLADLKKRSYIRPDFIDNLIQKHQAEHSAFYGEMIWVLMMLELWLQSHGF